MKHCGVSKVSSIDAAPLPPVPQREHMELLNKNHSGARCSAAGNSSDCRAGLSSSSNSANSDSGTTQLPGGSSGSPSAAMQSAAALAAADPAAALHRMHANLQALKVRKQRVTGGTPLTELQQQAESASERLLLAKLQEAGRIMEEQESVRAAASGGWHWHAELTIESASCSCAC